MKMMVALLASVTVAAAVAVLVKREPVDVPASAAPPPAAPNAPAVPAAAGEVGGQVREAFDVADYTYLRLQPASGSELWAAVTKTPVAVGSTVAITNAARMTNFHSASLKRTFEVIYFGSIAGGSPHAAQALPPGHPEIAGHAPPGHGAAVAVPAPVAVSPASGESGRTIAALFAERATLAGQKVRVRGQVVKATPVQGISYIRLRDGSSTDAASAELVVSSRDGARVGEVVTFEGTVGLDVDVGIGTKYPVMLQEAKLAP